MGESTDSPRPRSTAILLAGGAGQRMQGAVQDKILVRLARKPLILHSIEAFLASAAIDTFVIVCRDSEQQAAIEAILPDSDLAVVWAQGGKQRQDSVWAGLQATPSDTEIVLVHDCARPCITPSSIRESIAAAVTVGAACLARQVTDTIKNARPANAGFKLSTVDRSTLWAVETPQTFRFPLILDAYERVIRTGARITDDLSAIESQDQAVAFIEPDRPNPKLTTAADLPYLEFLLTPRDLP